MIDLDKYFECLFAKQWYMISILQIPSSTKRSAHLKDLSDRNKILSKQQKTYIKKKKKKKNYQKKNSSHTYMSWKNKYLEILCSENFLW